MTRGIVSLRRRHVHGLPGAAITTTARQARSAGGAIRPNGRRTRRPPKSDLRRPLSNQRSPAPLAGTQLRAHPNRRRERQSNDAPPIRNSNVAGSGTGGTGRGSGSRIVTEVGVTVGVT